jgi:predicted nuclease with TOPRIM domain
MRRKKGGWFMGINLKEKMEEFDLTERQEILGLALGEAYRRIKEIQDKINELENEQGKYQEMIDSIRDWQDELKG